VPEILRGGHAAEIARWRRKKQLERTLDKRPALWERSELKDPGDLALLAEIEAERYPVPPEPVFDCRRAEASDLPGILHLVEDARAFLKSQGVDQWQNGYPASEDILADIGREEGWLFLKDGEPAGYLAFSMRESPAMTESGRAAGSRKAFPRLSAPHDGTRGSARDAARRRDARTGAGAGRRPRRRRFPDGHPRGQQTYAGSSAEKRLYRLRQGFYPERNKQLGGASGVGKAAVGWN
jgi:hypothetical protein